MVRSIKTTRQDIYIRLVENAASQENQKQDSDQYVFKYQYELFSLGAIVGYAQDQMKEIDNDETGWSQEILKINNLDETHEHRVPVEMVNRLILLDFDEEDLDALDQDYESLDDVSEVDDVWELVLRYADAGVEYIDEQISVQDNFDLVGIVRDFSNPEWRERLREVIVHPDAHGR